MFIRITGWATYQHYKQRDPPWIKLHKNVLTSESWVLGTDISRLVQISLMLLAGRYDNTIPGDFALISKVASLDCSKKMFESAVMHLMQFDFIECTDEKGARIANIEDMAERKANRTRDEILKDAESKELSAEEIEPDDTVDEVIGLNDLAWRRYDSYRKKIGKAFKAASISTAQRKLSTYGNDQMAVVEQTIERSWIGLFPVNVVSASVMSTFNADAARTAWNSLLASRGDSRVRDSKSAWAVEQMGGFSQIRMRNDFSTPLLERKFIAAYAEAPEQPPGEPQAKAADAAQ